MNRSELADIFGIARHTVDAWLDQGMPYLDRGGRGKSWTFETTAVLAWWAETQRPRAGDKRTAASRNADPFVENGDIETFEEAERRKMVAQADRAELDLAKAARLVVPIDEVAAALSEEQSRVRTRLLAIPNAVRVRVTSYFGGDRKAEESVVGEVETLISEAMAEIRGDEEEAE